MGTCIRGMVSSLLRSWIGQFSDTFQAVFRQFSETFLKFVGPTFNKSTDGRRRLGHWNLFAHSTSPGGHILLSHEMQPLRPLFVPTTWHSSIFHPLTTFTDLADLESGKTFRMVLGVAGMHMIWKIVFDLQIDIVALWLKQGPLGTGLENRRKRIKALSSLTRLVVSLAKILLLLLLLVHLLLMLLPVMVLLLLTVIAVGLVLQWRHLFSSHYRVIHQVREELCWSVCTLLKV